MLVERGITPDDITMRDALIWIDGRETLYGGDE